RPRTGDHAHDFCLVRTIAGNEFAGAAQHHDRAWFRDHRMTDGELLGAVGAGKRNIARDDDISLEEPCRQAADMLSDDAGARARRVVLNALDAVAAAGRCAENAGTTTTRIA